MRSHGDEIRGVLNKLLFMEAGGEGACERNACKRGDCHHDIQREAIGLPLRIQR